MLTDSEVKDDPTVEKQISLWIECLLTLPELVLTLKLIIDFSISEAVFLQIAIFNAMCSAGKK